MEIIQAALHAHAYYAHTINHIVREHYLILF